jgi:hypothetical protein
MIYSFAAAMKAVAAIILMFLFSVQTCSTWLWVLDYQLNKDYIAQNLCVNKAKPKLHCNGKCQLSKKLAEEHKNNTSGTASYKEIGNSIYCKQEIEELPVACNRLLAKHQSFYVLKSYTSEHPSLFHPPAVYGAML